MFISSIMTEKSFNKSKQLIMSNFCTKPKSPILYINNITFNSPIYTFSLAGNIIVYTPIQETNRGDYFNYINFKGKMPTLARNK